MANFSYSQSMEAAGLAFSAGKTYSASLSLSLADVAAAETTTEMEMTLNVANVKAFAVLSDVDVTLKTNSSGSPTNTLALKGGIPYIWNTDSYDTFKLTDDVTALFFTNAGETDANIKLTTVVDATP